jgi:hypothetical protein
MNYDRPTKFRDVPHLNVGLLKSSKKLLPYKEGKARQAGGSRPFYCSYRDTMCFFVQQQR